LNMGCVRQSMEGAGLARGMERRSDSTDKEKREGGKGVEIQGDNNNVVTIQSLCNGVSGKGKG